MLHCGSPKRLNKASPTTQILLTPWAGFMSRRDLLSQESLSSRKVSARDLRARSPTIISESRTSSSDRRPRPRASYKLPYAFGQTSLGRTKLRKFYRTLGRIRERSPYSPLTLRPPPTLRAAKCDAENPAARLRRQCGLRRNLRRQREMRTPAARQAAVLSRAGTLPDTGYQ